jgi:hypothetical protein
MLGADPFRYPRFHLTFLHEALEPHFMASIKRRQLRPAALAFVAHAVAQQGDIAYVKWLVRAIFIPGADGKPVLHDNGIWEVVSGTGKLKGLQGAGMLHIKQVSQTDRNFILEGELASGGDEVKK